MTVESAELPKETGISEESGGRERRQHRRFPCEGFAEALILHPETLFRGEIRDISLTGCFIRTRARLKVERLAEVRLRFILNGFHYHVIACVMDVRPGKGVGLEFRFADEKESVWLPDLIKSFLDTAPSKSNKKVV